MCLLDFRILRGLMERILITGASGFIGQSLCVALNELNAIFIGTDLYPHSSSVLKIDIRDPNSLKIIGDFKPDAIVHLAAQADVAESFRNPIVDLESNILGTVNLLQAAIMGGVRNFIYIASGGAIYDENRIRPTNESDTLNLKSPYGISKIAGEFYVKVLADRYGLTWSSLALSNCYGPVSQCKKGVIYQFWEKLSKKVSPTINGPLTTRDFIYVSDVIGAIIAAIENPTNCRVNISTGKETSLVDLFAVISKHMDAQIVPIIGELDSVEVARSCLDNSLAKSLLGWKPKILVDEGIRLALLQ